MYVLYSVSWAYITAAMTVCTAMCDSPYCLQKPQCISQNYHLQPT